MAQAFSHVFIAIPFTKKGRDYARHSAGFLTWLGIRCEIGEVFGGGRISDGVRSKIANSSFVIAILPRNPSHWLIQEVAWADGHAKPYLLLVEEGRFNGGILGDVEVTRFKPDHFLEVLPQVLAQVLVILEKHFGLTIGLKKYDPIQLYIPNKRVKPENASAEALYEKTLTLLAQEKYAQAFESAKKFTAKYPNHWPGWITLGALHVRRLDFIAADEVFNKILDTFPKDGKACGAAYHNLAQVLYIKTLPRPSSKVRKEEARLYRQSLICDGSRLDTMAALICTYVLLKQNKRACALLDESAGYSEDFFEALRQELKERGASGIEITSQLPTWAQNVLYPIRRNGMEHQRRDVREVLHEVKGVSYEQTYVS
jgi:tetratricopeptide (TPR) repeat protein